MGVSRPRAAPQPHCPSPRTLRAPPHRLWRGATPSSEFFGAPSCTRFHFQYHNSVRRKFCCGVAVCQQPFPRFGTLACHIATLCAVGCLARMVVPHNDVFAGCLVKPEFCGCCQRLRASKCALERAFYLYDIMTMLCDATSRPCALLVAWHARGCAPQ